MRNFNTIIENSLSYYQERKGELTSKELKEKRHFLKNITANPRKSLINFVSRYAQKIFPSLKNITLSVDPDAEPENLIVPQKPVIYVSNHLSNLDSLIIGLQLYQNKYPFPVFAAGENLFTNILSGYLMKSCGAFKIKREISKDDEDYMLLLHSLLRSSLEENISKLIFAEGTRSRDRTLGEFKRGLLTLVLNSHFENQRQEQPKITDTVFVPLGLAYTKDPEDTYFIEYKDSKAQKKDLFIDFYSLMKDLQPVYMRIGKPISTKEFFGDYVPSEEEVRNDISKDFASFLRLKVRATIPILHLDIIHHAIGDIVDEELTDTIHLEKLKERTNQFIKHTTDSGYKIFHPSEETIEDHVSRMHDSGLLKKDKRKITIIDMDRLKYYANKLTTFLHRKV